ncbi:MAG: hypothetical protein HY537_13240 [Deltaproteobacteria bacterium]|nr:hypothetical protein [Deltaproteobacteria bacterium]
MSRKCILFCFLLSVVCNGSFHFYSPLFERLEISELLDEHRKLRAASDSDRQLDFLLVRYFLAHAYSLAGKIHHEAEILSELTEACNRLDNTSFNVWTERSNKASAALVCSVTYARASERAPIHAKIKLARNAIKTLELAKEWNADPIDRMIAEATVYAHLPPFAGQNFGRSLLALHAIRRLRPDLSSIIFLLGYTYQLQGNLTAAEVFYKEVLTRNPTDPRARNFFREGHFVKLQERTDGIDFGWSPSLFVSPSSGFGARLHLFDDRLFDNDSQGEISVQAGTRGNAKASGTLSTSEWAADLVLRAKAAIRYGIEDFYGLGISTSQSQRFELTGTRWDAVLGARRSFLKNFFFELGWEAHKASLQKVEGGGEPIPLLFERWDAFHSGAYAELGFDNRNHAVAPTQGSKVSVKGYFPTEGLGSDRTFQRWDLHLEHALLIDIRNSLQVRLLASSVSDNVPLSSLPGLSGELRTPGMRELRFVDNHSLVFGGVYRLRAWRPVTLFAFSSIARVASTAASLFSTPVILVGGGGIEWHVSHSRREIFSMEVGYLSSGEWSLVACAGRAL